MPKPLPKSRPWAGISTGASRLCSARTRTFLLRTTACCPAGTAYITDVGMTGPHDSVIGMEKKPIVQRFLDSMPTKFTVAEGDVQMNSVEIDVDPETGRAKSIERVNFRLD